MISKKGKNKKYVKIFFEYIRLNIENLSMFSAFRNVWENPYCFHSKITLENIVLEKNEILFFRLEKIDCIVVDRNTINQRHSEK